MPKENVETKQGTVIEALPNTMFRVLLQNTDADKDEVSEEILAYLSGKMRKYRIRVLVGDTVRMEMDPYGGKARIVTRL